MTTPRATEMPLRLEPVQPDPFIESLSRFSAVRPRPTAREERERRMELVRRMMRARADNRPGIRNGLAGSTD
jgi:hypothetical protein